MNSQRETLQRFLDAQDGIFSWALQEIANGKKYGHWMWFVFPQLRGIGYSPTSLYYGIEGLSEARNYLEHPVLGERLRQITDALLTLPSSDIRQVMDTTDAYKLRSCMTLFASATENNRLFMDVLNKFFNGMPDPLTIELLEERREQQ